VCHQLDDGDASPEEEVPHQTEASAHGQAAGGCSLDYEVRGAGLFTYFDVEVADVSQLTYIEKMIRYSIANELCPTTGRRHVHVMAEWTTRQNMPLKFYKLKVDGVEYSLTTLKHRLVRQRGKLRKRGFLL